MNWNCIKKIILIAVVIIIGISGYRYFFKSWSVYYQEKLYKDPRPLLVHALQFFDQDFSADLSSDMKKALDLGAGSGNDTAYLLKNGWRVWANDKESEAIRVMATRVDIQPYKSNITLVQSNFIDLSWDKFPLFDLIYAGYALPFIDKDHFNGVWNNIIKVLKQDGILAVHFFGARHQGFNWWERRSMTFVTKEDIADLLKNFKIIDLKESYDKNDRGIVDHSFSVIAKKLG